MSHPKCTQASQLPLDLSDLTATAPPLALDHLTTSELRYLHGPITPALARYRTQCGASVQPKPNGWDFPDRLRPIIPAARWLQIIRGRVDPREKDLASAEEALGYLSCASLEAPLSRDWAEIFFHLGQQVFPRWAIGSDQPLAEALGLDIAVELSDQQSVDLHHFRRWLRRTIETHAPREPRPSRQHPSKSNASPIQSI